MKKAILSIAIFFLFGRFFSYFSSSVPLGYDSGIYLYIFKIYSQVPFLFFLSLPDWLIRISPGINISGKLVSYFIAPEKFFIPMIIFFSLLLFFAVYLLANKLWNQKSALWSAFIFASSAIQFRAYWYYYLKNISALGFLALAYLFLYLKSWWAVLFSILVIYFHRPTAVFLFVSLLAGMIFQKEKRKYYLKVLAITVLVGAIYYLPTFEKTVLHPLLLIYKSTIPQSIGGTLGKSSGTFFEPWQALLLALPYLPFAIYGLKKNISKKNAILIAPLFVSFIVVIFKLSFNRRIIIFLDFFLILFAGAGIIAFIKRIKNKKKRKVFEIGYALALILFISTFIYKTAIPQIYEDELQEIKLLRNTETNAYVLVTDEAYMPWIYGWSDRKTIAPGYGEYDIYWTGDDWLDFYELGDRQKERELLLKLPKPLYIFDGDHQWWVPKNYDFSGNCFERVNWRTYKFICKE